MTPGSRPIRVTKSGELIQLHSPGVGIFTPTVEENQLVSAGQVLGIIDTLGVVSELRVPSGVTGRVRSRAGSPRVRVPVGFAETLLTLSVADLADASVEDVDAEADASALAFTAPMSGRFYGRPSPAEPPFVVAGATVTRGQTVGLLEVMKTFNRLVYQGEGLPEHARIVSVVPADGDDVTRGDPILRLDSDDEG